MSELNHTPTLFGAAYVIFRRENTVLLGRRCNTGYMDGKYGIPAGHVEIGESAVAAAIREAQEEVGIILQPHDLTIVYVMKRQSIGREYADYVFCATRWEGEPRICEPDKCDDLQWFPLSSLPDMIPYERIAVEQHQNGSFFLEYGYQTS